MSGVSSAVWRSMRSSRDGARSTRWRSPACANGWPASARRIPAAFPAGAPLRLLGGFAGNGRRFRHGPWASGWLSAGVVRCRARRPGEIPAYGGVSGWFGLRNRPKFAVHRRSSREAVGRAAAARCVGYIDGFPTGAHEASPRSCGVLMTRWMLGSFMAAFWLWCPEERC